MNQDEHKIVVRRMAGLIAAASVLIAVYVLRLIFLQLVNSDSFKAQATNTTDYNFTVTAARGDIVDSAGRRIAASTTSYNVVLSKLLMGDEDLDAMLQRIVELLEAHGEKWNDSLLIGEPDAAGHYSFTAQADSTSDQKALAAMKDSLGLQQYATADDVMEKLVEDYKLESYPLHWQRVLGGIHYEMQQQAFSNVNNFVMAENVSEVTVATIKENSLTMPGVEIVETSTRSYDEGDIIPHVLGRVGKITAEKWKVTDENGQTTYPLREKGYNMNDMIGVSGLEAVYEDELRGKDGVETITRSSDGVIVGTAMTTVPEPGHTVQLTIDSAFQQAVDKALARNIEMINSTYNSGSSAKAAAGAVVVISTKDGSVLAASNYPSYDQNLFATQYSQYSSDPGLPLLNRALQGLYTPGSTFKPAVAVAALDSGVINRSSTVYCNGVYTYYDDYRPKCTRHGHSGNIDVITAIKWSCNIFFYDVGRRTTSDVYDAYAYKMGLGTRTGVEVNEATGRLTTKNDSNYTASLDIQAAIGQGNTVVTPVQLATYAGTLANRGVRYRTHFVKAILDTNTGKVLQETQPEVMDVIEDRGDTFDLVRQGMIGVSETVSGLKNYPVTIACKTGTPQRSETYYVGSTRKHYTNTMMVAYGPAEDAEIALGIVIEYGGGGARAGNLVADIVASQVDFHARFGGVVPEIASRKHIEAICGVCDECLDVAAAHLGLEHLTWSDLDAVAVTYAPGLMGALVVGVAFAKGAAWGAGKPLIGVNHLEGHLYANKIGAPDFEPPAVVSLVSGGNTMLVHMRGWGDYETLGATIDDAAGEAFDKVAKALGLGYPGGPVISREAAKGDPNAIPFPRAMMHSGDLRFSLSGLKPRWSPHINNERAAGRELNVPNICASFQQAVVDVQVKKAEMALEQTGARTFCLGGGVAANPALRDAYEQLCERLHVRLTLPPLSACGDNAGMIALVALDRHNQGKFFTLEADAQAHANLDEPY